MKMMNRFYSILLILLSIQITSGQQSDPAKPTAPSGKLRVSLLTCGQGEDLYTTFGHSAVRIIDSSQNLDLVYNYGTFEYTDDIWFYVNFTRGKLKYMLDVSSYDDFVFGYIKEGRSVSEQVIDLPQEDLMRIYTFLETNLKPENRYYKYDFYYDNCSTRIRDLFEKTSGKKLMWSLEKSDGKTMRRHLNPYIAEMPWVKWGFYLTLGHVTDVPADSRKKMFLPNELEKAFDKATIKSDSSIKPLITKKAILLDQKYESKDDFLIDPVVLTLVIILLIGCYVSHLQFYKDIYWKWYDSFIFTAVGLLGILILFLWFMTDHQTTRWNFNIFWALPTHIIYLLLMKYYKKFYNYTIVSGVFIGISILMSFIQPFHLATYIVIFILTMRLYVNYRYAKHYNVRRLAFSKIF